MKRSKESIIEDVRINQKNMQLRLLEDCIFESEALLKNVAIYFCFSLPEVYCMQTLFDVLNIECDFPIRISGKNRRNLTITTKDSDSFELCMFCHKISVVTTDGDQKIIINYSINFILDSIELNSIEIYSSKQYYFVDLQNKNIQISLTYENKKFTVENLPYLGIESAFDYCTILHKYFSNKDLSLFSKANKAFLELTKNYGDYASIKLYSNNFSCSFPN